MRLLLRLAQRIVQREQDRQMDAHLRHWQGRAYDPQYPKHLYGPQATWSMDDRG